MSPNSQLSFWTRIGLAEEDRTKCLGAVCERYPGCRVQESKEQGYCSFTLVVSRAKSASCLGDGSEYEAVEKRYCSGSQVPETCIVQIRPEQHSIDLDITQAAKETYGSFVPRIEKLDCTLPPTLEAFEMERISGVPFAQLQPRNTKLDPRMLEKQEALVRSFASFTARGWSPAPQMADGLRGVRADTPVAGTEESLLISSQCQGKVGSQMVSKFKRLAQNLPDSTLRRKAAGVLAFFETPRDYPVVLNHGDLIPSNILIDPDTWEISGIVDWAEAEFLPFGTCLYGLEHLLGYLDRSDRLAPRFRFYDEAPKLREVFRSTLFEHLPELERQNKLEDLLLMRDAGVLLWYGYAWDEGRIDRVVNEEDDREEIECLRAFLRSTDADLS
jgi:hypothetical protein